MKLSPKIYLSRVLYYQMILLHAGKKTLVYEDMAYWAEARQKAHTILEKIMVPGDRLQVFGNGVFIGEWKK